MKNKNKLFYTLILLSLLAFNSTAQDGIQFFHGTWEEALVKAKEENKLIFVDAFAVWCGPCKRMAKNVFTQKSVGDYYNAHFVNLKLDMEKTEGRAFRQKFPVTAYPTLLYINEKGELLKKEVGGRPADRFISIGKTIADTYDRSGDLAELYEKGDHSYEVVFKYVQALNNANKSSLKISNEFLRSNPDLSQEERANFLFEALTNSDSRIFDLFVKEREDIEAIKGKQLVAQKIEDACWKSVETAMEFESKDLMEEAKLNMKKTLGNKSKPFALEADYQYAKAVMDLSLLKESSINIAKISDEDPERIHDLCHELKAFKDLDASVMATSEELAKMAADKGKTARYYLAYSKILAENNKSKKALKTAQKALKKAQSDGEETKEIQDWITSLK